jgi:hypothetical protein
VSNWIPDSVDPTQPSVARIYDYLLDGSHNFAPDREVARKLLELQPNVRAIAQRNRAFLRRAVLFMIDAGIRQFLDLGSGIPTVGNVHEVAQQAAAASRVLYVEYETVAVTHSQLLLEDNDHAAIVQADITRPDDVLNAADTQRLLDFHEPVGVLAVTIGHYIPDDADPVGMFARYRDAVPTGSYLALTHLTNDFAAIRSEEIIETMSRTNDQVSPRSRDQVLALFGDFELVPPGLVTTSQWRPDTATTSSTDPEEDGLYAGIGRKN